MQSKRIALITGANQGVGFQVAKELVANGLTVLVGSRNFARGGAAKEIGPGAIAVQLDVTDRASIAVAAERIRKEIGRLDLLVNNAAISNTRKGNLSLGEYAKITLASNASLDEIRAVWETNVLRRPRRLPGDAAATPRVAGCPHRQRLERSGLAGVER
jgi:NAD(P)-dependent dehydrogenase (short-subunit alcohol dehydrogenase family)